MRVLILTRYTRQGASSRMRLYQYLPWLASAGIDVEMMPLFSDNYVSGLQSGQKSIIQIIKAYVKRTKLLLSNNSYDLVWIEKELFPWLPYSIERLLLPKKMSYVLDYDDAVFHYYDLNTNPIIRWLLSTKHANLIKDAQLILVGNEYLADFAKNAGAKQVECLPTVIDLDRYPPYTPNTTLPPCVGWIGQYSTASFLKPYKSLFTQFLSEGRARFAAIGIDTTTLDLPMTTIKWSEKTEVSSICNFDIGIMPLVDEPFERGKCGYKLIQYMACGLPVIASPVGINKAIVEHGINGFLAETQEQWQEALNSLLADPELRKRMGQAGREKVEQKYCLQVTGPKLAQLLWAITKKTQGA